MYLIIALISHLQYATCHVFDVDQSVVVGSSEISSGALFGYSLDIAQDRLNQFWVLVGAPKDRSSRFLGPSGSFHACRLDLDSGINQCFKREANPHNALQIDDTTDQMLGVSVAARTGPVVNGRTTSEVRYRIFNNLFSD